MANGTEWKKCKFTIYLFYFLLSDPKLTDQLHSGVMYPPEYDI